MKSLLSLFLLSLMITIGCGNANSNTVNTSPKKPVSSTPPIAAGQLQPKLWVTQSSDQTTFHFIVKNRTKKPISLQFNTTQNFDYIITDSNGKEAASYSKGKAFGQLVSRRELKQGGELSYTTSINALKPGKYHITFWLTDTTHRPKSEVDFQVN